MAHVRTVLVLNDVFEFVKSADCFRNCQHNAFNVLESTKY